MQVFGLRVKAALGITLLAVAAMTGCSGMSTPGTSAGPSLSFTQSSVTFGSVAVGKTKTFTETITNSSAAMSQASVIGAAIATNNITILQISSSSSSYSVTGISLPATLAPWAECHVHSEVHSQEHGHAGGNSVCQHRHDRADDIEPDGNGSNSKHHRCEPQQPEFRQRANRDNRSHSGSVVELRKLNSEHFFDRRIGNRICVERSKCSDRSRTGSDGCFQCKVLANNHWIADGFIQSQLRCLQFTSDDFGNR